MKHSESVHSRAISRDYHDYVFRDGKLVGDFDAMYRESSEVPWHQDKLPGQWWLTAALTLLQDAGPFARGIDLGCGLGYVTALLAKQCGEIIGLEVSPTAVARARAQFPALRFEIGDVRSPLSGAMYDLVAAKDLIWYVLPWREIVRDNIAALTRRGGYCWLVQSFPDRPYVGEDIFRTPDDLLDFFSDSFECDRANIFTALEWGGARLLAARLRRR